MNTKNIFLCCCCFLIFFFNSCVLDNKPDRFFEFDENGFVEKKQKWHEAFVKDYSFKFSVSDTMPNRVIGYCVSNNGTYSAEIIIHGADNSEEEYNQQLLRYESIYGVSVELEKIEDVFAFVETRVNFMKNQYMNSNIISYEIIIDYDEEYGFPVNIKEKIKKNETKKENGLVGDSVGNINLKVFQFESGD